MSDLPVRPNGATLPVPCTTVIPPPDYQGAMNKWTQHQLPNLELCIAFLNGEEADRKFVMETANEWVEQVDLAHERMREVLQSQSTLQRHRLWLRFKWLNVDPATQVDLSTAHIRINFGTESLSCIGSDALSVVSPAPTMHLSLHTDPNHPKWQKAWRRNHVLHEFGHALGLLHEHQLPQRHPLLRDKVIAYYTPQMGEKAAKFVEKNILPIYSNGQVTYVHGLRYDPDSIMIYQLHRDWLENPSEANVSVLPFVVSLHYPDVSICR